MSNFYYYQRVGGEEPWKPQPVSKVGDLKECMFVTALSLDAAWREDMTKQELDALKYKGPLYFDLDNSSPATTATKAVELLAKLKELDVSPDEVMIYTSGKKGFHLLVPEECFLLAPNKKGIQFLPAIYKELAFKLAVDSMDFRVYTARRGRMLRQANVQRPENGLYKVRISADELFELKNLADSDEAAANEKYRELCSAPRADPPLTGSLAGGLAAAYDAAVNKVSTSAKKKKVSKILLPKELPSFDMLLEGLGIKSDAGFHNLAMQIAIMAHSRKMTKEQLLEASKGLCEKHSGDGGRYNTFSKRQDELARMFLYMEDNPCYDYAPNAIKVLLTHDALDLQGVDMTREEIQEAIDNPDINEEDDAGEYGHAGVIINRKGVFSPTENGLKQICALSFDKVVELTSVDDNQVQSLEADVLVGGRMTGRKTINASDFNSVNAINKFTMGYGQAFTGNDNQGRGVFMRVVEKARKSGNRMYATRREGLDLIQIPFAEQEELRKPFLVWTDAQGVKTSKEIQETGVQFRFVGFPDPQGSYQTDLSLAPDLAEWIGEDDENKRLLKDVLKAAMHCQHPKHVGKWLGWNVACHYRMLFHSVYSKFPLLHVNGAAGQGKTESTKLFANLHYYNGEPKMLTPSSSLFAVTQAVAASASIPMILDEFKPSEMAPQQYERFKLILRDAYNCRNVERGGGNQHNSDYRSIHQVSLSAPMCFIAEAAESETAVMERVVLLTLTRGGAVQMQEYRKNFEFAVANRHVLGILGQYLAASVLQDLTKDVFKEEFDVMYNRARKALMLQEDDFRTLEQDEIQVKAAAKERTVYNYTVMEFGLRKLQQLVDVVFPGEFDDEFNSMYEHMYNTMEELRQQTMPEWLKVFNTFSMLAKEDGHSKLVKGEHYDTTSSGSKELLVINLRAAYHRYRVYCSSIGEKALYSSEAAFILACNNLHVLEEKNVMNHDALEAPGGVHVFDLNGLRVAGFIDFI